MSKANLFKWRHYPPDLILRCVRWYCSYPLSYRQLAEIVNEPGLKVNYATIFRWVQQYGPELERRCRPHLRPTNDSWRVDETYVEVKGKQKYLYRAVDSQGKTLDFLLTALARCPSCQTVFPQGFEGSSQSRAKSD
jgi:transposase-like protein